MHLPVLIFHTLIVLSLDPDISWSWYIDKQDTVLVWPDYIGVIKQAKQYNIVLLVIPMSNPRQLIDYTLANRIA